MRRCVIPDRRHADTQANNSGSAGAAMRMAFIDLSNLTFVAGQSGSDSLKIGATDGFVFSGWSPLTSLTVNAPVDNPPVVSAVGTSVPATKGEVFQASDLFSASDADHDSLAYLF